MERLVIRLLGEPTIHFDGKPVRLPAPPRAVSLLALLGMRAEPISRGVLSATLWPDDLESAARANLRRHVYQIQKALPKIGDVEWILADTVNVAWNGAAPAWIDVRAFFDALEDPARRHDAIEIYR